MTPSIGRLFGLATLALSLASCAATSVVGPPRTGLAAIRRLAASPSPSPTPPPVLHYEVLYNFQGGETDGTGPNSSLISDGSGALYGTTYGNPRYRQTQGTVFKLTPNGSGGYSESVLYIFLDRPHHTDGYTPQGVVLDSAGALYGTNQNGGTNNAGTIWKLTPAGGGTYTESILYTFQGGSDGANPFGQLAIDASGTLYGTTSHGGNTTCNGGCGTAFRLVPRGAGYTYKQIHAFAGYPNDGSLPEAGLLLMPNGTLVGSTYSGGAHDSGAAFSLTPSYKTLNESVLYSFNAARPDLGAPASQLFADAQGDLYGTADAPYSGGVYRLKLSNSGYVESTLYDFKYSRKGRRDGRTPVAGVVTDPSGNLYGMTPSGQRYDAGIIYELSPTQNKDVETVLYVFDNGVNGGTPLGGLLRDGQGALYGTASAGGATRNGVVFRLGP